MNLVLTLLAIKVSQSAPNIRVFPVFDIQRVFSTTFQCSGGSHRKQQQEMWLPWMWHQTTWRPASQLSGSIRPESLQIA